MACDQKGYRLGYGGGFYDRLLCQKPWQDIPTMGIIFDFAYVDELPTEEWDQPLDYICTEKGIIELKKRPLNYPLWAYIRRNISPGVNSFSI